MAPTSVKEPHYFSYGMDKPDEWHKLALLESQPVRSADAYKRLMARTRQMSGEASTSYLWHRQTPSRLAEEFADPPRVMVVLRDPVERALSSYNYMRRRGLESTPTFRDALQEEWNGQRDDWPHMWRHFGCGQYGRQLERYFDSFHRQKIGIYYYRDLVESPRLLVARMLSFILGQDVPSSQVSQDIRKSNPSGRPRCSSVQKFLVGDSVVKRLLQCVIPKRVRRSLGEIVHRVNLAPGGEIDPKVRRELRTAYQDDHQRLLELLEDDKPPW